VGAGVEVTVAVCVALGEVGLGVPTGSTAFRVVATSVFSLVWSGVGVIPFLGNTQDESASNKAAATSRAGIKGDHRRSETLELLLFTNSSHIL
jgi:hypothetical protein